MLLSENCTHRPERADGPSIDVKSKRGILPIHSAYQNRFFKFLPVAS